MVSLFTFNSWIHIASFYKNVIATQVTFILQKTIQLFQYYMLKSMFPPQN